MSNFTISKHQLKPGALTTNLRSTLSLQALTMSNNFPASPPAPESKEGSYDLHRIAQHNATTLHRQSQFAFDGSDYLPSGSSTSFNSPQPDHRTLDHYGRSYNPVVASLGDPSMAYQTVSPNLPNCIDPTHVFRRTSTEIPHTNHISPTRTMLPHHHR